MNKPAIFNTAVFSTATRTANKLGLTVKKHSPEILVVAGVVGAVASAVMACKATLKVHEVLATAKTDIDDIHEAAEKGETKAGKPYTPEDCKRELAVVYVRTAVDFAKLYGPAIILGTLSVTSILASNNIMRKRNVALAAAYATVDNGFKEYRDRVIERFGKDLDRELKYNIKAKEVTEVALNEDGSETTVTETVEVADDRLGGSPYAVIYDDGCTGWTKDPALNKKFLLEAQQYANWKLKEKGYLFLNEVYEMIGIPKTQIGHMVGWVYDEKGYGDNYVDFGIFDLDNERKRAFVNYRERNIILDFNVDGNIYDLVF